jgi:hypothetical protein
MLRHLCQFLAAFVFSSAFLEQPANAEPITTLAIKTGSIQGDLRQFEDAESFWDVSGDSFSIVIDNGVELPSPAIFRPRYDPSYTFVSSEFRGRLRLDSHEILFRDGTVQVTFTAPLQPLRPSAFDFPFTMVATLAGRESTTGDPFRLVVRGHGRGRLFGSLLHDKFVTEIGIWEFESAPIPEPSTTLLVAIGAIAGLRRRWNRG